MNLEEAIDVITKHINEIERNIEMFVNKYATFYYDGMTQHAEFYFGDPDHNNHYNDLVEKRNKMRTTIMVLEELKNNDYNN